MAPPSWRAYLVSWFIWWKYGNIFRTPEDLRQFVEQNRKTVKPIPPDHLYRSCVVEERHRAGCMLYDISPKSEVPNQARVLLLHGGSYVCEIEQLHWREAASLAERLQAVVTVAIYPLGPEHSITEIFDAVQPTYDEMALPSRDNTPFFVVGDSAGGSLALSLTQRALLAGRPVASRVVLISPVLDWGFDNPEIEEVVLNDPYLKASGLREAARLVSPDIDPKDPQVSPLFGDLDNLPPIMLFTGTFDILWPDAKLFAAKMKERGKEIEFIEGEGMLHVWPLVPFIPEADEAMDKLAWWLERAKS